MLSSAGSAATATFVSPGPTYAITVGGASGTGLGNYIISYTPATLTITQAALTVDANDVTKTYGDMHTFDTTTPSTDFSVMGLKNSDSVDSVTLSSEARRRRRRLWHPVRPTRSRLAVRLGLAWVTTSLATHLGR